MLFDPHVGEADTLAEFRDRETLAFLDLAQDGEFGAVLIASK
jgi:hypothetical protein